MWQYELVGMAAAIWPALFCLIAPPRADASDELQGRATDVKQLRKCGIVLSCSVDGLSLREVQVGYRDS